MNKIIRLMITFFAILLFPLSTFAEEKEVTLYLFHGDGCPHCADELVFLEALPATFPDLKIVKYEVWYSEENSQLLKEVQDAFEVDRLGVPTTVIGDTIITGYGGSTGSKIIRAIQYYYEMIMLMK